MVYEIKKLSTNNKKFEEINSKSFESFCANSRLKMTEYHNTPGPHLMRIHLVRGLETILKSSLSANKKVMSLVKIHLVQNSH